MIRQLLVPLLCAAGAVALPAASTASATMVADFSLFAYGRGLGGHRVVEKDGELSPASRATPRARGSQC